MNWQKKAIKDFCNTSSGKTPSKKELSKYYAVGIPWVKSGELKESVIFETEETITKEALKETSAKLIPSGSLLVAMYGATIGRIAILGIEATSNQAVCHIIPDPLIADQRYMFYALRQQVPKWLEQRVGGAQPNISQQIIRNSTIPLPPLEEQKRIARILDKADEIRRKRKQAIALTDELLRSTFLEMFGDPVTNPKGWQVKKLKDVTTKITDGVHSRPKYTEKGIPFISVKDITTGKLQFDECKFISEEDHQKYIKRCKPELGDILYTKVGATYGRPALVDVSKDFSLYVSVCLIKPIKNIVRPQFLKEVMATSAVKHQADRSIKGIGVPDLHLNMIKEFVIPVPDLNIQDQFLEKTKKIHQLQSRLELYLQQSENLFNSLLQRAFKGEL